MNLPLNPMQMTENSLTHHYSTCQMNRLNRFSMIQYDYNIQYLQYFESLLYHMIQLFNQQTEFTVCISGDRLCPGPSLQCYKYIYIYIARVAFIPSISQHDQHVI